MDQTAVSDASVGSSLWRLAAVELRRSLGQKGGNPFLHISGSGHIRKPFGLKLHLLASVMFGLAEIEQEYRRERQAAGIAAAKRKGVYRGRKKGTTKVQPSRVQQLRACGLTAPEIATALGIHPRTVFRYLAESTAEETL